MLIKNTEIVFYKKEQEDYISLTDIAKVRDRENPSQIISLRLRTYSRLNILDCGKSYSSRTDVTINKLICLSNMENLNAVFINEGLSQKEWLVKLNQIAIQQMKVLHEVENRKLLK